MYTNSQNVILGDFKKDSRVQDWAVTVNPNEKWTCYKVNSQGCDVLTAQITKSNWGSFDDGQDVAYNAYGMNFNL
jgi:hypothetical protein